MEPLPETVAAIEELGPFAADVDLLDQLLDRGRRVLLIVPDCVGLSVASQEHGVTFTMVATAAEVAILDALQYIDGGPCVDAVAARAVIQFEIDDPMNESQWQTFAQAAHPIGVASTLSLPIVTHGWTTGSINLYASSAQAFAGHHDALAAIFGAWAPGAIANADLSFATRLEAQRAPHLLRDLSLIDRAGQYVADTQGVSLDAARRLITAAAARAGISEAQLAEALNKLHGS